jgi:hypothetical protein
VKSLLTGSWEHPAVSRVHERRCLAGIMGHRALMRFAGALLEKCRRINASFGRLNGLCGTWDASSNHRRQHVCQSWLRHKIAWRKSQCLFPATRPLINVFQSGRRIAAITLASQADGEGRAIFRRGEAVVGVRLLGVGSGPMTSIRHQAGHRSPRGISSALGSARPTSAVRC